MDLDLADSHDTDAPTLEAARLDAVESHPLRVLGPAQEPANIFHGYECERRVMD